MGIFRVMVRAEGLRVTFDDEQLDCGFYKNEFVWAANREMAIRKALANVESALRRKPIVEQDGLTSLRIEVDEVEANVGIAKLLQRHGFAFYKLGEDQDTDEDSAQ
jgi:hypothetical protein